MTALEIIGQAFGFIAMGFTIISFQAKAPKKLLVLHTCGVAALVINYILIGAVTGMVLNIIAMLRNFVFASNKKIFSYKFWVYLFMAAMAAFGFATWQNAASLLIIVALVVNTYYMAINDNQRLRKSMLFTSSLAVLYNIIVFSPGGMCDEALAIASCAIGLLRYRKTEGKKMKIKGAIFDMDGTLVDSLGFWSMFWEKFGTKYLNDPSFMPPEKVRQEISTMLVDDGIVHVNRSCNLGLEEEDIKEFIHSVDYQYYEEVAKAKDGAFELLEHLKSKGVKMAVASASDLDVVVFALKHYGIADYLDAIVSCSESGKGKESPDVYLNALEQLGTKPEDTAVFEDSFVALGTAKNLGMHTFGIYDCHNYGHDKLRSLSEIYMDEGQNLADLIKYFD